jgi:DNA polymerase III subunit alpha, Gram-positive type
MYTVIDIETTGLSKRYHQITEIAAAKVKKGIIIDSFQTLVNPEVRIPSFITKLTGIDNKMVRDSPTVDQVLPDFKKFLDKDVFVAHNATFDFGFLAHNLKRHYETDLINKQLCTRKLANRLFPELPRKRLGDLCSHLDVQNHSAHRAMGDVLATVKVFNSMLNVLQERGIIEVDEVLKFERSSIRKGV